MTIKTLINEVKLSSNQEKERQVFNSLFAKLEKQSFADKVWDYLEKNEGVSSNNRRTEDLEEILFDLDFKVVRAIYNKVK